MTEGFRGGGFGELWATGPEDLVSEPDGGRDLADLASVLRPVARARG